MGKRRQITICDERWTPEWFSHIPAEIIPGCNNNRPYPSRFHLPLPLLKILAILAREQSLDFWVPLLQDEISSRSDIIRGADRKYQRTTPRLTQKDVEVVLEKYRESLRREREQEEHNRRLSLPVNNQYRITGDAYADESIYVDENQLDAGHNIEDSRLAMQNGRRIHHGDSTLIDETRLDETQLQIPSSGQNPRRRLISFTDIDARTEAMRNSQQSRADPLFSTQNSNLYRSTLTRAAQSSRIARPRSMVRSPSVASTSQMSVDVPGILKSECQVCGKEYTKLSKSQRTCACGRSFHSMCLKNDTFVVGQPWSCPYCDKSNQNKPRSRVSLPLLQSYNSHYMTPDSSRQRNRRQTMAAATNLLHDSPNNRDRNNVRLIIQELQQMSGDERAQFDIGGAISRLAEDAVAILAGEDSTLQLYWEGEVEQANLRELFEDLENVGRKDVVERENHGLHDTIRQRRIKDEEDAMINLDVIAPSFLRAALGMPIRPGVWQDEIYLERWRLWRFGRKRVIRNCCIGILAIGEAILDRLATYKKWRAFAIKNFLSVIKELQKSYLATGEGQISANDEYEHLSELGQDVAAFDIVPRHEDREARATPSVFPSDMNALTVDAQLMSNVDSLHDGIYTEPESSGDERNAESSGSGKDSASSNSAEDVHDVVQAKVPRKSRDRRKPARFRETTSKSKSNTVEAEKRVIDNDDRGGSDNADDDDGGEKVDAPIYTARLRKSLRRESQIAGSTATETKKRYTVTQMTMMALKQAPGKQLSLEEIAEWIKKNTLAFMAKKGGQPLVDCVRVSLRDYTLNHGRCIKYMKDTRKYWLYKEFSEILQKKFGHWDPLKKIMVIDIESKDDTSINASESHDSTQDANNDQEEEDNDNSKKRLADNDVNGDVIMQDVDGDEHENVDNNVVGRATKAHTSESNIDRSLKRKINDPLDSQAKESKRRRKSHDEDDMEISRDDPSPAQTLNSSNQTNVNQKNDTRTKTTRKSPEISPVNVLSEIDNNTILSIPPVVTAISAKQTKATKRAERRVIVQKRFLDDIKARTQGFLATRSAPRTSENDETIRYTPFNSLCDLLPFPASAEPVVDDEGQLTFQNPQQSLLQQDQEQEGQEGQMEKPKPKSKKAQHILRVGGLKDLAPVQRIGRISRA